MATADRSGVVLGLVLGLGLAGLSQGCDEEKQPSCELACERMWDQCKISSLEDDGYESCLEGCLAAEEQALQENCQSAWEDVEFCCSQSGTEGYLLTVCNAGNEFMGNCEDISACDGATANLQSCIEWDNGFGDDGEEGDGTGNDEPVSTDVWGSCPSSSGESCVAMNFGAAMDAVQAEADFRASCIASNDGDEGAFEAGRCSQTGAVGVCENARGSLETTGEEVPIEVVWYQAACDLGLDPARTCMSLGSMDFSGSGC